MVSMIWAESANGAIGDGVKMPWNIPEDLARFKRVTQGKRVVMGRKTYESIGRPLPGRENIVLTSRGDIDGVKVIRDISDIPDDSFIIGGGGLYRDMMPLAKTLYITQVAGTAPGNYNIRSPKVEDSEFSTWSTGWMDSENGSFNSCVEPFWREPAMYRFVTKTRITTSEKLQEGNFL